MLATTVCMGFRSHLPSEVRIPSVKIQDVAAVVAMSAIASYRDSPVGEWECGHQTLPSFIDLMNTDIEIPMW